MTVFGQDPCKEVRVGFLEKLHKGLATCHLPLSYMAIFSYYGVESDKAVLATVSVFFCGSQPIVLLEIPSCFQSVCM